MSAVPNTMLNAAGTLLAATGLIATTERDTAMSTTIAQLDLDKLRHIVQKFDASSFTAAGIANEYSQGAASHEEVALIEEQLQRHAPVLGIQALPAQGDGTATVWRTV